MPYCTTLISIFIFRASIQLLFHTAEGFLRVTRAIQTEQSSEQVFQHSTHSLERMRDEKGEKKKNQKNQTPTNQTTCSQPSHKGRCSQKLTGTSWCGGEGRWLCALCPQLLPTAVTETPRCCSRAQPGTCSMSRKSSGGL